VCEEDWVDGEDFCDTCTLYYDTKTFQCLDACPTNSTLNVEEDTCEYCLKDEDCEEDSKFPNTPYCGLISTECVGFRPILLEPTEPNIIAINGITIEAEVLDHNGDPVADLSDYEFFFTIEVINETNEFEYTFS